MLKLKTNTNECSFAIGFVKDNINLIEIKCLKCCLNNVHKHFVLANKINKLCMD